MTVSFVTLALSYRARSTSSWKGWSGLEKLLMVTVALLIILSGFFLIALLIAKPIRYTPDF